MAYLPLLTEKQTFWTSAGAIASGYKLFIYLAGTTTKATTYQETTGTANTNPVVLNSRGEVPYGVYVAAGSTYKLVLAPSTDSDPPVAAIWTRDALSATNDTTVTVDQWQASGYTPTYVSATSFTVTGDRTSTFQVGRRIKSTNTGGTIYSTITVSAYSSVTTVTVVNDSGTLDSGLSAVSVGLLTPQNPSNPIITAAYAIVSGSSDITKKLRLEVDGITTATTRVLTVPDYDSRISNLPAGIIMDYAGSSVPTGWLECDGSAVSRTTYSALFTAISTTWGVGNGSTTFNLPDFRGRVRLGKGTGATTETVTASSSNGFTVVSNNSKWIQTQPVVLSALSGFTTTASAGPTYYVCRVSTTNVRLATTLALAQNNTPDITISGTGSCTITYSLTARTLAEVGGEDAHAIVISELLAHTHTYPQYTSTGSPGGGHDGSAANGTNTSNSTGGNQAMSIMQPFSGVMSIISY